MALIGHWPLNGNLDNVYDLSDPLIYENNSGKLTVDNDGKIGQAYKRSAARDGTDWLSSTKNVDLQGNFTFAIWAKVSAVHAGTANGILTNHNHSNDTGAGITIKEISSSDYRISCNTGTGSSRTFHTYFGTTNIKDKWAHLALRFIKETNTFSLWTNGNKELEWTYAQFNVSQKIGLFSWSLGYNDNSSYRPAAIMNDARVYDHALTDLEIQELSRAKILHYTFNDMQEPTTNKINPNGFFSDSNFTVEKLSEYTFKVTLNSMPASNGYYIGQSHTSLANVTTTMSVEVLQTTNPLWVVGVSGWGNITSGDSYVDGFRYVRTITHNVNWGYSISLGYVSSTFRSNVNVGDYIIARFAQVEEKPYATEFVDGSRTGRVNDYSGFFNHSNDLTEANTPRWIPEAKVGTGNYSFNPGYINFPNLSLTNGAKEFSISMFLKIDTFVTGAVVLGFPGENNTMFTFGDGLPNTTLGYRGNINALWQTPVNVGNLSANIWYHVAVSYSPVSGFKMYLNGNMVSSSTVTGTILARSSYNSIGGWENSRVFDGQIDDVRIYATTLSDADMLDLYQTRAEIEQSGVLYARDFLSNAEETVNLATNSFLESGWTGSSELVDSTTKTFRLSQPFPNNPSAWRTYYYNVSSYVGQTITISAFFRVLQETNGNFLDVTVGQGNTGAFPLHIKGSNEIDKFTSTNKEYHFISWTGVINSTGIVGFTVWIHNLVSGALIVSELSKVQVEVKGYPTPFVSTFRPAIELPSTLDFAGNEIHETGTANFEDFSTVGITDGLIGYWQFNGNTLDYSGRNYNATEFSTGSSPIINSDNVEFQTGDGLRVLGIVDEIDRKPFTIIIMTSPTETSGRIGMGYPINTLELNVGGSFVGITLRDSGGYRAANHSTTISVGVPFLYTGTFDGSTLKLYYNGVFRSQYLNHLNDVDFGDNFLFGNWTSLAQTYRGKMFYAKIFNRALTAEEIAIEYNTMFNNEVQISKNGVLYAKDITQY